MTSQERLEAHLAETDTNYLTKTEADNALLFWQAAERDMLARCVEVCESRITPGTGSHAILMGAVYEMKELMNEQ